MFHNLMSTKKHVFENKFEINTIPSTKFKCFNEISFFNVLMHSVVSIAFGPQRNGKRFKTTKVK